MNDLTSFASLEDRIRSATVTPAARPEFVDQLYTDLMQHPGRKAPDVRRPIHLRPAWITVGCIVLIALATLIIGPRRVYAAILKLFGYLPGVGIVDQSAPLRVLAEPISITRDGVTVSVNSVTLTGTQTILDYGVSGVPLSAYPQQEAVQDCYGPGDLPYLRLPDGATIAVTGGSSQPVPFDVQEAVFVLPCIFNTIPGSVPADWELPLRFIPAPPDLTVYPVLDITPTAAPADSATAIVAVEQVIQTEDGYILTGTLRPQLPEGSWLQVTGVPVIRDANGKTVPYTFPTDVQPGTGDGFSQGEYAWAFQIKGAGLAFPLEISFSGVIISRVDPQATAELAFDTGSDPQPGQEWEINQDVRLGAYSLMLVSVTADRDGYSFRIRPGVGLTGASVQIAGYQAMGGGGGGGPSAEEYVTSLAYAELPKGNLTIVFSDPVSTGAPQTWVGHWQPEGPAPDWSTPAADLPPVCLSADSLPLLPSLPTGLNGRALLTELNPELNLVLASFDGGERQVLVQGGSRGVLSPDGRRLAYPDAAGIEVMELSSGNVTLISTAAGYSLRWSPDGRQIAFVTSGGPYGIFIVDANGSSLRQLTDLGYESIVGWSLDGSQVYYAIPGSGNNGFQLKAAEVASGDVYDLFVLENSSGKAPMATISPDGAWIAYRGRDNGSLYIVRMDGTGRRLVVAQPSIGYAISGIAWGSGGDLIGVSMISQDDPDGEVILIQWDGCEAYRIGTLHGELDGLLIP